MSGPSFYFEEPPKVYANHVRELRSLDGAAKSFLYTVLSHKDGEMFRSAANAAEDMGICLSTFYRTRSHLLESDLIWETQKPGHTTLYQVNPWTLHTTLRKQSEAQGSSTSDRPTSDQEAQGSSTSDRPPLVPAEGGSSTRDIGSSTSGRPPLVPAEDKEVTVRGNNQSPQEEPTRRARPRSNPPEKPNRREGGKCIAHGIKDSAPTDMYAWKSGLYDEGWCGHLLRDAAYRMDNRDDDIEFHLIDRSRAAFLVALKELESA